jgi:outer membrane protein assembly factor BamB
MRFLIIASVLLLIGLLSANAPIIQYNGTDEANTGAWPCFGQNQYHTGLGIGDAPDVNVTKAWTYTTYGAVRAGVAIDHRDRVLFGSDDNMFYCLNSNGTLAWKFLTYGYVRTIPCIDGDGLIYVGSDDGKLYCFFHDGYLKYSTNLGSRITGSPTVDDYGVVYFGTANGRIYAVRGDGSTKWYRTVESGRIVYAPTLDRTSGIFVTSYSNIYMLEMNGNTRWYYDSSYTYYPCSVDANKLLYFAGTSKLLYCHLADRQSIPWTYNLSANSYSTPSIDQSGNIYAGCDNYVLHCVKPNGSRKWSYTANEAIAIQPVIDKTGDVVFATIDGWLHSMKQNGTLLWKYNLGGATRSELAIAKSGQIIVGLENGNVVAITGTTSFKESSYSKPVPFKFEILGNPVRDMIKVSYSLSSVGKLRMHDVNGKFVSDLASLPIGSSMKLIAVPAGISNGVYIITLTTAKEQIKKSVIVLH